MISVTLVAGFVLSLPQARAATFEVDSSHSTVLFKVKHAGVGHFYGRFNDVRGLVFLDDNASDKASITIDVKTDSVDSASADRDRHIKGQGSLAAEKYPLISFRSKRVKATGTDTFLVSGTLSFRGVARDLEFRATRIGSSSDDKGGRKVGLEATFRFKRSDFGWTGFGSISDDVDVIVSLECNLKKTAVVEEN